MDNCDFNDIITIDSLPSAYQKYIAEVIKVRSSDRAKQHRIDNYTGIVVLPHGIGEYRLSTYQGEADVQIAYTYYNGPSVGSLIKLLYQHEIEGKDIIDVLQNTHNFASNIIQKQEGPSLTDIKQEDFWEFISTLPKTIRDNILNGNSTITNYGQSFHGVTIAYGIFLMKDIIDAVNFLRTRDLEKSILGKDKLFSLSVILHAAASNISTYEMGLYFMENNRTKRGHQMFMNAYKDLLLHLQRIGEVLNDKQSSAVFDDLEQMFSNISSIYPVNTIQFVSNTPAFIVRPEISSDLFFIMYNLVNNAWKYSFSPQILTDLGLEISEQSKVQVEYFIKDNELNLVVRDNGIGIPQDKLDIIFEEGICVHGISNLPSSGIGLHHVQLLTNKIGGHVSVNILNSEKYKTEFVVAFPLDNIFELNEI